MPAINKRIPGCILAALLAQSVLTPLAMADSFMTEHAPYGCAAVPLAIATEFRGRLLQRGECVRREYGSLRYGDYLVGRRVGRALRNQYDPL